MVRINNSVNSISGSSTTSIAMSANCLPTSKYYESVATLSSQKLVTTPTEITGLAITLPQQGTYLVDANVLEDLSTLTVNATSNNLSTFKLGYSGYTPYFIQQTNAPQNSNWLNVVSNVDGTILAIAPYSGYIYVSTDSGKNWVQQTTAGSRNWFGLAMSLDGKKIASSNQGGYIWTTTNSTVSSGGNWIQQTNSGSKTWTGICGSTDGVKLAAISWDYVYTSVDSGVNWVQRTNSGSRTWGSIASSGNGTKLIACVYGGAVSISSDSGVNWSDASSIGTGNWISVACSADGQTLAACTYSNGYIWLSTNGGTSWTQQMNAGQKSWSALAISANGSYIAATNQNEYIYTTSNFGTTWVQRPDSGAKSWSSLNVSASGDRLISGSQTPDGYIYTDKNTITDFFANSERIGTQITSASGSLINQNAKNSTFNWLIKNTLNNTRLSVYGSKLYQTTGYMGNYTNQTLSAQKNWGAVNVSQNGNYMIAVINATFDDNVYVSADGGSTWVTKTSGSLGARKGCFISDNGQLLAISIISSDYIYVSTNGGANWTQRGSSGHDYYANIVGNSTGSKLITGYTPNPSGYIAYSSDSGTTWTNATAAGSRSWTYFACDSTCTNALACVAGGYLYRSTDSGATWTELTAFGTKTFNGVASNSTGTILYTAVGGSGGGVWKSINSGTNWTQALALDYCGKITCDSTGTYLSLTQTSAGYIRESYDGGISWNIRTDSGNYTWNAIASSLTGTKLLAAPSSNYLYTRDLTNTGWNIKSDQDGRSTMTARLLG